MTVWHELMSLDREKARFSYAEVIGLTAAPLDEAPFPYTIWMQDGEPVVALVPPKGKKSHWANSFATEDVDRAVEKAQERGSQVLVPTADIPKFGRAAVLKDSKGAVLGDVQKRG